jgi:hypothetical protein
MREVVFKVDRRSFRVGLIPVNHEKTVRVDQQPETAARLSFIGPSGRRHTWEGGYLESSGYRIRMVVDPHGDVDYQIVKIGP